MGKIKVIFQELAEWARGSDTAIRVLSAPPRVFQFNLSVEEPFHVIVGGGKLQISDGFHIKPVIKIIGESAAAESVAKGEVDITQSIAHGKLTIAAGDFSDVIDFGRILTALISRRKQEKK